MQLDNINNKIENFSKERKIWHGLTITNSAAQQILFLTKDDPNVLGLKLNIKRSGCAGFSYSIEKAIQINKDDLVYEHNGAKLYVPLRVMPVVDGTKIDYIKEGLNHVFKFKNPQASHICGCGSSFNFE